MSCLFVCLFVCLMVVVVNDDDVVVVVYRVSIESLDLNKWRVTKSVALS